MQISGLRLSMHDALSRHLASEFCSATLTFSDGGQMRVVALNAWRRDQCVAYEHGVEEPRPFNPAEVVSVELVPFDLDQMAITEAVSLGIVLDADAARKLTPGGSAPGAQAAE